MDPACVFPVGKTIVGFCWGVVELKEVCVGDPAFVVPSGSTMVGFWIVLGPEVEVKGRGAGGGGSGTGFAGGGAVPLKPGKAF